MATDRCELNERQAIIRMMGPSCQSGQEALRSELARRVIEQFLQVLKRRNSPLLAVCPLGW